MGATNNGKNTSKGGMRNLFSGKKDVVEAARKAVAKLEADHPFLFELLGGFPAENGIPAVEPGTLTFFVKDGALRFSANVNSMMLKFSGECQDVLNPFGAVNTALAMGDVTQKEISERPYTPKGSAEVPH